MWVRVPPLRRNSSIIGILTNLVYKNKKILSGGGMGRHDTL